MDADTVGTLLRDGDLTVEGRLVEASNATLYCAVSLGDLEARCVYKPVAGERPLWDFPDGSLAGRELATYRLSEATAGDGRDPVVPPSVMRDGPFGEGMVQLWIDVDVTVDIVALTRSDDARLRRIALFDAVVNNADRKGGHLLPAPSGRIYGIDHGICFHVENKLRTVLWNWRGKRLTPAERELLTDLGSDLDADLGDELEYLLTRAEVAATRHRIDRLLSTGRFPMPSGDWPPIPWPPF